MLSAAVVFVLAMRHSFPGLDAKWHLLFIITTTSLLPNERVSALALSSPACSCQACWTLMG